MKALLVLLAICLLAPACDEDIIYRPGYCEPDTVVVTDTVVVVDTVYVDDDWED